MFKNLNPNFVLDAIHIDALSNCALTIADFKLSDDPVPSFYLSLKIF